MSSPVARERVTTASASAPSSVAIVDDERMLCDLLAHRLKDEPDFTCAGAASTPDEARTLVRDARPDIILLDGVDFHSRWPDNRRIDPLEFAEELVALWPSAYLLIWTHWQDPLTSRDNEVKLRLRAARAGAEALVLKGKGLDHLLEIMRHTITKGPPSRNHTDSQMFKEIGAIFDAGLDAVLDPDDELTKKERERVPLIARSLEEGMKIPEIAKILFLAEPSLRTVMQNLYQKWGVNTQSQFVAEAKKRGYV